MRFIYFSIFLFILLGFDCKAQSSSQIDNGVNPKYTSPNKKYSLLKKTNIVDGEQNTAIFLTDNTNNQEYKIYDCTRCVNIIWSPMSDKILIKDHITSSKDAHILISVNNKDNYITIEDAFEIFLARTKRDYGYIKIQSIKWISGNGLKFTYCLDNGRGPDCAKYYRYIFEVGKGFRKTN